MSYQSALDWLLETDLENPGVRYFALRDLLGEAEDAPDVQKARRILMETGTAARILSYQGPDGSWPSAGTSYQGTASQILFLAELGADPDDGRVRIAGLHILERMIAANGGYAYGERPVPSQVVHCHNATLAYALLRLGFEDDPRLLGALDWQARAILGEAPVQYYKSATSGPGFECGVNLRQPCGWGATKAVRALAALPVEKRSLLLEKALQVGAEFLIRYDLVKADFPYTGKISGHWFRFGFPLSYWSDLLETAGALVDVGFGRDSRLAGVLDLILEKGGVDLRWKLEDTINGKMWVDIEEKGQPSKWVTLRALRVLKKADRV